MPVGRDAHVEDVPAQGGDEVMRFDAEALVKRIVALPETGPRGSIAEKLCGDILHSKTAEKM